MNAKLSQDSEYKNFLSRLRTEMTHFHPRHSLSLQQGATPEEKTLLARYALGFKKEVPDNLHFIWIGRLKDGDFSYLKIWHLTHPGKKLCLWQDKEQALCVTLHHCLREHVSENMAVDHGQALVELQNTAFHEILEEMGNGVDFNMAVISFLFRKGIIDCERKECLKIEAENDVCEGNLDFACFCDINELFVGPFAEFKKYYYYEILLRGNPAAASDIVRLIILALYGGIYLDIDTLPSLDSVFLQTDALLEKKDLVGNESVCLARSQAFIDHLSHRHPGGEKVKAHLSAIKRIPVALQEDIYSTIMRDLNEFSFKQFSPLPAIMVYPDFLALSSLPKLEGVYFNNVIAACSGSKSIRLILTAIKRRYGYLEKSKALFSVPVHLDEDHPLSMLLDYRRERLLGISTVTLSLTGPGVIIDTMIRLARVILKPPAELTPYSLSVFMQNEACGVAFFNQTLDTPMGLSSCWRGEME